MTAAATTTSPPIAKAAPGFRGVVVGPGAGAIEPVLASLLGERSDKTVLKDNAVRTVYRAAAPGTPWRSVIVKVYKKPPPLTAAKHAIVGRPFRREWRGIARVRAAGLAAPEPLATGIFEGRPFLVTAEIASARTAGSVLRETRDRAARASLLAALARLAAGLAGAGLFHRDLHTGNFLVGGDGEVRVIDLHTLVRLPRFVPFWRAADRARLFQSLLDMTTRTERLRFVRAYAGEAAAERGGARAIFAAAEARARALERRRIRSRTKRCVVRSSEFWREEIPGARLFYRRSFGRDAALAAVAAHERATGAAVLKNGRRTKVTRVETAAPGRDACVKEHRVRGLRDLVRNLVWRGRARNEWMAGHALAVLGLATPRTLALVEGRGRRSSFVVTEFAPALRELDRSIHEAWAKGKRPPPSRRRPLVRLAAELVATLHARRLYHNDLKAKNLLLGRRDGDGAESLWIIDLTGVRVGRRFTQRRRLKNLAQLDTSLPPEASRTDRLRFLREYLLLLRTHEDRKALARAARHAGRHRTNYWNR